MLKGFNFFFFYETRVSWISQFSSKYALEENWTDESKYLYQRHGLLRGQLAGPGIPSSSSWTVKGVKGVNPFRPDFCPKLSVGWPLSFSSNFARFIIMFGTSPQSLNAVNAESCVDPDRHGVYVPFGGLQAFRRTFWLSCLEICGHMC